MTAADANPLSNRSTQKMLRHRLAVMTLARIRAKKSVLFALRAQGLKPQHFSAREIAVLADFYLNQHRERLLMEATEAIATWPGFAGWRLPPGHEVFVKSAETEHLPMASGCCGQNGQSL
jgi:hypothetical protein